jgi:predicted acyltransferase
MKKVRLVTAYILIGFLILITLLSLLGIWDVIHLEDVVRKLIGSLLIIFGASVVALFIFQVIIKNMNKDSED